MIDNPDKLLIALNFEEKVLNAPNVGFVGDFRTFIYVFARNLRRSSSISLFSCANLEGKIQLQKL